MGKCRRSIGRAYALGDGSNFLIKREQSEACFDFAEREESQRS